MLPLEREECHPMATVTFVATDPNAEKIALALGNKIPSVIPVKYRFSKVYETKAYADLDADFLRHLYDSKPTDYFIEIEVLRPERTYGYVPDVIIVSPRRKDADKPERYLKHLGELMNITDIDHDVVIYEPGLPSMLGSDKIGQTPAKASTLLIKDGLSAQEIDNIGGLLGLWLKVISKHKSP